MRRMYSEQELTKVIGDVIDSKIEDGSFDESIADYIDEYLVEHPVDITALVGKDVSLKTLTSTGDVSVGEDLAVVGNITGGSIIENMSGYTGAISSSLNANITLNLDYAGIVKNGNKLSLALAGSITRTDSVSGSEIFRFQIPSNVASKLYPMAIAGVQGLSFFGVYYASNYNAGIPSLPARLTKGNNEIIVEFYGLNTLVQDTEYLFRIEQTFLLSDSLVS